MVGGRLGSPVVCRGVARSWDEGKKFGGDRGVESWSRHAERTTATEYQLP
jgi:hypothetical protein